MSEVEYLWTCKELSLFLDSEMRMENALIPLPSPTEHERFDKIEEWMRSS